MTYQARPKELYRQTINLPRTAFPMRAQLPVLEPQILQYWQDIDLYHASLARTAGQASFILHDGPSFGNGEIHLGHALNKVAKDIIIKFRSMQGFYAPFVPGWDTYGLPTEIAALRTFHTDRRFIDPLELRRRCAETARKYVDKQRRQFQRLGVRGDWAHPYLTMQPAYQAASLELLGALVDAGMVYRGLKPVYWCLDCETALAEAEIAYIEHKAPSVYVAFPAVQLPDTVFPDETRALMSAVIWTTTPWSLPANVAVAVHPDLAYVLVTDEKDREGFTYLVAAAAMGRFAEATWMKRPKILGEVRGHELDGARFLHPFMGREAPLVLAEYVAADAGSGLAHVAPGHGKEDFITGTRYDLPMIQPVGPSGIFGPEAGPFAGIPIYQAEDEMLRRMDRDGTLLAHDTILQQYPHCWRCRQPVIQRATPQWFVAVEPLRARLLSAAGDVRWLPAWGHARMNAMLANRPDWCISRRRGWGTPIPALLCTVCREPLLSSAVIARAAQIIRKEGAEAWFRRPAADFTLPETACPHCGGKQFRKGTDVLDVWFDSGCSHAAVLAGHEELSRPADLYMEGHDQFRGWFQASLITAVGTQGKEAPYKSVLAHGFVLDDTGRKQAKSLGNIIRPQEVIDRYGADLLRLWVASTDIHADVVMSEEAFAQVIATYRRIRNTIRFMLGNLHHFSPANQCHDADLVEIDCWVLQQLNELIRRVTDAYDRYEFHRVYHAVNDFCAVTLSARYLEMAKDTLYLLASDDPVRRSAQTALLHLTTTLAQLLAPVLSFTAEEIWQYLPGDDKAASVQLTDWPTARPAWDDAELMAKWTRIFALRAEVTAALEIARRRQVIPHAQAARITLYSAGETERLLESFGDMPAKILLVATVEAAPWSAAPAQAYRGGWPQLAVGVARAPGAPCARCRRWRKLGEQPAYADLCGRCATLVDSTARQVRHAA